MRQLLPVPIDQIDAYTAYRPDDPQRPLVRVNMVSSLDGAVTDADGVSGGLGGDGDRQAFFALRALADGIVAGAGTVRAEGYRPHRLRPDLAQRRAADGRPDPAPIVVVTRSGRLDADAPLFVEARTPTIVLTCQAAGPPQIAALREVATVLVAGDLDVDLRHGFTRLRERYGLRHLLVEGGPSLNGDLFAAGLVDELCVTVAASLRGEGRRMVQRVAGAIDLALLAVLEHDGELLLRYGVTSRPSEQPELVGADPA